MTVAAPSTSTTTSTHQLRTPVDAEQLAPAPATNPEYPHSSSTGGMAARCPASSSEPPLGERGQTGAGGSSLFQSITRTIHDYAASSPVSKANTQRTQGLATTPPPGSPPPDSPYNPTPDASGASADACEQIVAPQTSPSHHRDTTGSVLFATLPSRDQPPLDASVDPTSPTFGEADLSTLLPSLPVRPSATLPSVATEGIAPQRDAAASLSGYDVRALGPAAAASSTLPMDSTAARPAFGLEDPARQSHSNQAHLFAAASLREALNAGGLFPRFTWSRRLVRATPPPPFHHPRHLQWIPRQHGPPLVWRIAPVSHTPTKPTYLRRHRYGKR